MGIVIILTSLVKRCFGKWHPVHSISFLVFYSPARLLKIAGTLEFCQYKGIPRLVEGVTYHDPLRFNSCDCCEVLLKDIDKVVVDNPLMIDPYKAAVGMYARVPIEMKNSIEIVPTITESHLMRKCPRERFANIDVVLRALQPAGLWILFE